VTVREDRPALAAALAPGIRLRARWRLRPGKVEGTAIFAGDVLAVMAALFTAGSGDTWLLLTAAGALSAWFVSGFYHCRLTLSVLDDVPRLASGLFTATGVVVTGGLMLEGGPQRGFVTGAALLVGYVLVVRALLYEATRRARRAGYLVRNAVIVGGGEVGARLACDLANHPEYGLRVAGFVDDKPPPSVDLPGPLLGGCRALGFRVTATQSDVIVLADCGMPESQLIGQLRAWHDLDCEILFVPRLHALEPLRVGDRAWSVPLARLAPPVRRRYAWRVKRLFDIVVSGAALALLAPVLLVTALAVRVEIGRSVLFRQERVGRDGRRFTLLKFRSLHPSADAESDTRWNIVNDGWLGPVGRVLRATSLDELPQLVNVLRGDMSLVGPRPERPFFAQRFARELPHYDHRHRVDVGLTGWAAVHGLRGDTSIAERADFDNFYIDNWSFWTDVKVMIRTIPAMLRRAEPGLRQRG